jgi:phage head maturation protease
VVAHDVEELAGRTWHETLESVDERGACYPVLKH